MKTILFAVALLALLVPAAQEKVTVVKTFPGASGPGPKDCPDNTGAVGPRHAMDFTNANVVIHAKETGQVVLERTQSGFWKTVKPGFDLPAVNDPRLLYDPLSGRWFGAVAGPGHAAGAYLAVSETSDPTQGWRGIKLPMEPTD